MPNIDLAKIVSWVIRLAVLAAVVAACAYAFGSIAGYGSTAIDQIQGGQQMTITGIPGKSFILWILDGWADPLNLDFGGPTTAGWVAILQPFAIGLGVLTIAVLAWKIVSGILR